MSYGGARSEGRIRRLRRTGILAAAGMRILLLLAIGWILGLETELFELFGRGFS